MRFLAGIWWLSEDIAEQLEKDRKALQDIVERAALERKWFVYFAAMVIVQQHLKDDSKMHFIKNYKGDVVFGFGDAGKNNQELYEKANRLVIAAYRQGMQDPQFNHRNWQRSHKSVNAIRSLAPLTDFAT